MRSRNLYSTVYGTTFHRKGSRSLVDKVLKTLSLDSRLESSMSKLKWQAADNTLNFVKPQAFSLQMNTLKQSQCVRELKIALDLKLYE